MNKFESEMMVLKFSMMIFVSWKTYELQLLRLKSVIERLREYITRINNENAFLWLMKLHTLNIKLIKIAFIKHPIK